MIHKVMIMDMPGSNGLRLLVDNKELMARSFSLRQADGEITTLEVDIPCFTVVNKKCEIDVVGLDKLAKLMDETTLNKFVSMWNKYHSEEPK